MIRYYFDKTASAVIRIDDETLELEQLPELNAAIKAPPPADMIEVPAGKRKYTQRAPDQAPSINANGKRVCSECGSGSRHKKGCSRGKGGGTQKMEGNDSWKGLGEVAAPSKAMSRMSFGRVKISQEHDIEPEVIARNMDLPIAEIRKAFEAGTYDEYQRLLDASA